MVSKTQQTAKKKVEQDGKVPKLKKSPFRLFKRFYKPKTSNKMQGVPFDPLIEFINFRKKSHSAEKNPEGGPFGLTCTFGSIKNLWFKARIEPTLSGFRKFVEVEQMNKL